MRAPRKLRHPNIVLRARIDFEVVGKLATETGHLDRLSLAESAHVDARRCGDEYIDVARAVVNDDDESERQIIDDGLTDRSRDTNDRAFRRFTYISGRDRQRLHFWATPVSFSLRDVDEHEQSGQHRVGERAGHAHLLLECESEIVRRADVNTARSVLNRETLIERRTGATNRRPLFL